MQDVCSTVLEVPDHSGGASAAQLLSIRKASQYSAVAFCMPSKEPLLKNTTSPSGIGLHTRTNRITKLLVR